jgi:hypothetical protein
LTEFLERDLGAFYAGGRFVWGPELSDKSVSVPYHRLQVFGLRRIIFQRHTHFADGGVDAHFDIDEYVFSPEGIGDLLSGDEFSLTLDQVHQEPQGETFQPHWFSCAKKLEAAEVQLEQPEADFFLSHHDPRPNVLQFLSSLPALSR